jgi:hypothetical protein
MASEPGGRADKLGNEFERLWTVRHLIELLSGRASSVSIEALGDDEKGTEFWVTRPDGTREAHQCKRENASAGEWTAADLGNKKILSNARFQLDRDPSHRFVFTSADKAPRISDLCERARMCESPADFFAHCVTTSQGLEKEFRKLCQHLGLDHDQTRDLEKVFDFLRRFSTRIVDKVAIRDEVEELASRWLTGDPNDAIAALKDVVDKSIGVTLLVADVIAQLPATVRPRDLTQEPGLFPALEELRNRFDRAYRYLLIGGRILKRRETQDLHSLVVDENGPRLILLHGPGGEGKSGVVFELTDLLRAARTVYLPLRLDRDRPADTPLQYGRTLDLPASPAACLAAAADGQMGVLVLDQLDAIRWTAAHSGHAWDTCERVISEALRHSNLRVVVVCRSFDVEDHPQIRAWKERSNVKDLKVAPLDDQFVNAVVSSFGMDPATLEPRQRMILKSAMPILATVDRLAGQSASDARDITTQHPLDAGKLSEVLLRLYEQSEADEPLRRQCLDAWDRMLSERIGYDVLRHIDA